MYKYLLIFALILPSTLFAQELNCQVQVVSSQVQGSETAVYDALKQSIQEFMNSKKWTSDNFNQEEKIDCSVLITIKERVSNDMFSGSIQVQSRRPVFGTSYNSTVFNFIDNDFSFKYIQYQTLEFSETSHLSNLTAVLGFYAYFIIGLDYDSFAMESGSPHYTKAMNLVNNAQSAVETGWKAFEGENNRYWLVQNMLNPIFRPLRKCSYEYHRLGFDVMSDKLEEGRTKVLESIVQLEKIHNQKPNSFNMRLFFNAKADEIVSLLSQANPDEKQTTVALLSKIDPGNISKYSKVK